MIELETRIDDKYSNTKWEARGILGDETGAKEDVENEDKMDQMVAE